MLRPILIALLASGSLLAHPHVEPSVEASATTRLALEQAKKITLSEGLPHPAKESSAFKSESVRKDTHKLADFPFYTPALKPEGQTVRALKRLLADPANLETWTEKRCGGFHPDWSVSWRTGFRKRDHALICFGCQQVIYFTSDSQLRYNLKTKPYQSLKIILATHSQKRPKP